MGSNSWHVRVAGLIIISAACAPAALAQERTRPPVLVVEDLLGKDWKAARLAKDELARIGARSVIPLLEARAAAPLRSDVRSPIDSTLRGIVRVLSEEIGRPLGEPAERVSADGALGGILGACDRERTDVSTVAIEPNEFGELGSISADTPETWFEKRQVAKRARSALVRLGPPATGFLFEVPPLIPQDHARVLGYVLEEIYQNERKQILALAPEARRAFRARYSGVADLALPVVASGLRDSDRGVRAMFESIRDDVLETSLNGLDDPDSRVRNAAEDTLYQMGGLSLQRLLRVASGKDTQRGSAQCIEAATQLARRIRYGISRELLRRLGHDFEGYADMTFRERRAWVFEVERLGGEEAIPALRALLKEEGSTSVKTVAAIGLFRLGDPTGARWLGLNSSGVPLPQISNRELAAIYMDQGLSYLTLGRFERAEREFKSVLKVEPQNDIAWYNLACTYARWGKINAAIEHLVKAIEFGFDDSAHMLKDPDLVLLRDDERFKKLIADLEALNPDRDEDSADDVEDDVEDDFEDDLEDDLEESPDDAGGEE
jgi:tetratricopeptide (TPR) repeat protein